MPAAGNPDGPLVVSEGTPVTASATSTGPSPYSFDWQLTQGTTPLQSGTDPTFSFTRFDDGNLTIHLNLKDAAGELSFDTFNVLVNNAPPTVSLDALSPINENSSVTLTGSFTDPGVLDSHILTVNWADPNFGVLSTFSLPAIKDLNGMLLLHVGDTFNSSTDSAVLSITSLNQTTGMVGFSVQHQYLDDGIAPGNNTASDVSMIKVTVADDDQAIGSKSVALEVKDVAPSVALNSLSDIDENGTTTLTGSYTDIGIFDRHTVTINWDDPNNSTDSTFAIPALQNTAGGVTLSVGDTFNSSADDAVLAITSINAVTGQVGFSVQHQFFDDGLSPGNNTASDASIISAIVADDDTLSGNDTESVLVKNVAPMVTLNAVPDVDETGTAMLTGIYTDVGRLDAHTLIVDWDDPNNSADSTFALPALKDAAGMATLNVGDIFSSSTDSATLTITSINVVTGEVGFSVTHQYLDDGLAPGNNTASDTSTISVTVTDDDTLSGNDTKAVLVKNLSPTVALNTIPDVNENGTVTLTGTYTDTGLTDGHTLTVDWDDPNDAANSTFLIPAIKNVAGMTTLNVGDSFNSSTDGAVLMITSIGAATGQVGFSVQHQYLDDGVAPDNNTPSDSSTISVTVADDDTLSGNDTESVLVKNVAPTVALNAVPEIDENGTATLTGTYTDIGLLDGHTLTIDWDDPNDSVDSVFDVPALKDAAGMNTLSAGDTVASSSDSAVLMITSIDTAIGEIGFSVQHKYLDDGIAPGNNTASDTSVISVTVADDDALSNSDAENLLVKNVAPTVALNAVPDVDENGTATLTGTYTDIGIFDHHSLTVDWNDPNNSAESTFAIPSLKDTTGMVTLTFGDTFASSTDSAVLTITSIDEMTGTVGISVQHQYLDDGVAAGNNTATDTSTISVTVADDDTESNSDTETVLVKNIAPTVALNAVQDVDENGTTTLTGTYTDIGLLDGHTLTVDWDDPNNSDDSTFVIPAIRDAAGTATLNVGDMFDSSSDAAVLTVTSINVATGQVRFSVQHQYHDDGLAPGNNTASDTSTIGVTLADDDTQSGSDTEDVLVKNVAPTVALNAVPDVDENGTATLTGAYTDIGLLDGHTLTVDWDDSNNGDVATFAISAIRNAAGVSTLTVGDTFNSSTDGAVLTITAINDASGQVSFSVQHQYLDDGVAPGNNTPSDTSTISVTVADDDTQSGDDTADVLVNNVTPTVALNAVPGVDENGAATLTGSYTDIGLLDGHTLTVDWDDPNNAANSTFTIPAIRDAAGVATLNVGDMFNSSTDGAVFAITSINVTTGQIGFTVQHQYLDDGLAPGNSTPSDASLIAVTGADDDAQSSGDSVTAVVNNVMPTVALNTVPDIDENGAATLTGTYTDIGLLDGHTLTVDWDDPNNAVDSTFVIPAIQNADGVATLDVGDTFSSSTDGAVLTISSIDATTGQVGFSVQHQYLDDGLAPGNDTPGDTSTISVMVDDDDTQSGSDTETVLVSNVTPTVALNAVPDIDENGIATLSGSYTDVGLLDVHTLTVDWDDPNDSANSTFVVPSIQNAAGMATLTIGDTFSSSTDGALLAITAVDALTGQVSFSVQHQYLDDGLVPGNDTASDTSTISVTVADDDAQSGDDTEPVLVKNVNPVLIAVGNQIRDEGQLLDLSGSGDAMNLGTFNDIGTLDLHRAQIDWGDGHIEEGTVVQMAGGGMIVGSHVYADDGLYTVIVRLADDDMSSFLAPEKFNTGTNGVDYVEATFTVTVNNVTPSLTDVDPENVVNEGQAFVISNLAGGTLPNFGIGLSDPGFDNPLNPTTPTIGDPFQETFTGFTINWGDGTVETPVTVVMRESGMAGPPTTPTTALFQHAAHTYADDGQYTVRIRIADDNMTGNFTTGTNGVDFIDLTFTITVLNVNPTFAGFASTTTTINEAGSVSFNIDFSDPGFDNALNPTNPATGDPFNESFTYDINWGDGRQTLNALAVADNNGSPGVPSTGTFGGGHIYGDDGTYTVTVVIRDDNGGTDTHVFTVVVQNVNPSFVPVPGGASFEGDAVTSTGFTQIRVAFNDPGFDNTANPNPDAPPNITDTLHESFTHVFDWGDGTVDALHTYVEAGVYTVSLTITGPNSTQTFNFAGLDGNQFPILTLVSDQETNNSSVAAQLYTFVVDWGDGAVQTIPLMLRSPAAPMFNNGLTTVLTSQRTSGNEGVLTTGSFEVQHRYTGPPNPANPTEDIQITTTIIDDNNGSVSDFIEVTNPGISSNIIAFDTTPQVPRLEFVPTRMAEIFLGTIGSTVQSLQTQDVRVARSDQNLTSDVYLELRVVFPDGSESEGYRLPDDALQNLREIIATLPDNHYRIYLVRTENNSHRLVMEVVVRGGRVVDPSDDSEGTRDRPPTSEQNPNVVPLDQNPLLQQPPDQGRIDLPNDSRSAIDATSKQGRTGDWVEIEPVRPNMGNEILQPHGTRPPGPAFRLSRSSRWAAPLAAIGLTAAAGGWSKRLEAAMETADQSAWQRLRRAGRLGRTIRNTPTTGPQQDSARREYNVNCS